MTPRHNPAARYCVQFNDFVAIDDAAHCSACDEMQALIRLDPDLFDDRGEPLDITYPTLHVGDRVVHRTGQKGIVTGQPEGDPIVRFDEDGCDYVCYRSEVTAREKGSSFWLAGGNQ